jgi:hypothetical protein
MNSETKIALCVVPVIVLAIWRFIVYEDKKDID